METDGVHSVEYLLISGRTNDLGNPSVVACEGRTQRMQQCVSRSSHGLLVLARRCAFGIGISHGCGAPRHSAAYISRRPPSFPRLFCRASADHSGSIPPPELRPRMPAVVPKNRPKPTTAVGVVEEYLVNLWHDFFTNPHNWYDNRLKRREPKYADFKNKLTKEGLWITARWNPPWVRTELSLMTNFKPVPYDDPLWEQKRRMEEEEAKEKPPPVAPGAWLREELELKKKAKAAGTILVDAKLTPSESSSVTLQESSG